MKPIYKTCAKCKEAKDPSEFNARSKGSDKLRSRCKSCIKTQQRAWVDNNPDYFDNPVRKAKKSEEGKKWRADNKDHKRTQQNEYNANRRQEDPNFSLRYKVYGQFKKRLKRRDADLIARLDFTVESRYGYKVRNYKSYASEGLQVDHIVPLSFFDLTVPAEWEMATSLDNLQLLTKADNRLKSNSILFTEYLSQELSDFMLARIQERDQDRQNKKLCAMLNRNPERLFGLTKQQASEIMARESN